MQYNPDPRTAATPHLRLVEERATYDAKESAGGFAMTPRRVLALNDGNAIGLYAILAGYANNQGECWPSIATLTKATGWGRDKVIRTLKTLTTAGVVVVGKRDRNGLKQSNLYTLPDRKTLNVPMSHNGTTQSHSATLVVPIADSGSRTMGREQEPVEQEPKEQTGGRTRATTIPDDFTLTNERLAYAVGRGLSPTDARTEFEKLRNWAESKAERKVSWDATWRNWVIRTLEDRAKRGGSQQPAHVHTKGHVG